MRIHRFISVAAVAWVVVALCGRASAQMPTTLQWQPWSEAVFAQARVQHKFVLLNMAAAWCHWCHVMDEVTYRDPVVVRLLNQHYVLAKVDPDERPDLSHRFGDRALPATIVFAADGSEIVNQQGYIPPRTMVSMLQAIIGKPTSRPGMVRQAAFHPEVSALAPTRLRYQGQPKLHRAPCSHVRRDRVVG